MSLLDDVAKPSDSDIKRVAEEGVHYYSMIRSHINYFRERKGLSMLPLNSGNYINHGIMGAWYYDQCKEYIKELEGVDVE